MDIDKTHAKNFFTHLCYVCHHITLFEHLFHVLVKMSVNVDAHLYCLLLIDLTNRYTILELRQPC